jgi:hypothetical protein
MLKSLIALCVMLLPGAAWAGSSCYFIGDTQYCNGDNGAFVTGTQIGGSTYWNGRNSDGSTIRQHCYYIGETRYCN